MSIDVTPGKPTSANLGCLINTIDVGQRKSNNAKTVKVKRNNACILNYQQVLRHS